MTSKQNLSTPAADILVVDDTIASLRLLSDILTQAGYRVRPAERSHLALQSALAHPPGLILLDVRMPEMDGFELCRRLKQDERTAEIPVIFISALQDTEDKVRGFEVGGVDFVSKPFEEAEVLARVDTHLQLRNMQLHLEELVAERTAELTKANLELQQSEVRFRATFEQAAVGIAHVALDGSFLRLNQKFCDIVGYAHDEMLERKFQDITHPDDLTADLEHLQRILAGDVETYTMEKRYLRKDGEIVWVFLTVSLLRLESGAPDYFIAIIEDITEQKLAEIALIESEIRLELAATATGLGIWDYDMVSGYVTYDERWAGMLGYTAEELAPVPDTWSDLLHPDDKDEAQAQLEEHLAGNQEDYSLDIRMKCKNGAWKWIDTRGKVVARDENGRPLRMTGAHQDISERKQAEQELQNYQRRLKALAAELTLAEERERRRIAADLHDHVSQSLALARIQLGTARNIDSESGRNGMLDDVSQTLLKAIQDTRSLIFDLSSPMLNDLGLSTAVSAWLRDQIGTPYNLETKFDDDGQKKPLTEDVRAILFRNVRELLVNTARHAQANEIKVSLERQDASIKIMIRDDGVGFDPQQAVQMDHKKGGFGLFSIQERMADLGGGLDIVSAPGEGCTAILTAPLNLDGLLAGN